MSQSVVVFISIDTGSISLCTGLLEASLIWYNIICTYHNFYVDHWNLLYVDPTLAGRSGEVPERGQRQFPSADRCYAG